MATFFTHNGNRYGTHAHEYDRDADLYRFPDSDSEVCLRELCNCAGEVYIPKYAEFNGKRYKVTSLWHPDISVYKTINVNSDDRRKKPVYKSVFDYDSFSNIRGKRRLSGWSSGEKEEEITSVILPDSFTWVGRDAFAKFVALKKVVMSSSVIGIGARAFNSCDELEEITIPNSVKYIHIAAFGYCKKLKEITIPDSVEELWAYAFCYCSSLTSVTIGSGIRTIGERVFEGCDKLTEVNIYADPFEVMIAPNAFPATAKVNYLGKKAPEKEKKTKEADQQTPIDLDRLIDAVLVDGVLTDKERSVIMKKAEAAGYDADEVEILLDARLYEKQAAQKPIEKQVEKKKPAVKPAKEEVSKPETEVTPKVVEDSTAEWSELLWEPVKAELLNQVKVKMSIPKGKPYAILASENHKGLLQYILQYSVREDEAIVRLETYGGEDAKNKFDAKIAASPAGHPLKEATVSQGQKNKDKWAWAITIKVDKSDADLVKWYAETLLAFYTFMEDIDL